MVAMTQEDLANPTIAACNVVERQIALLLQDRPWEEQALILSSLVATWMADRNTIRTAKSTMRLMESGVFSLNQHIELMRESGDAPGKTAMHALAAGIGPASA